MTRVEHTGEGPIFLGVDTTSASFTSHAFDFVTISGSGDTLFDASTVIHGSTSVQLTSGATNGLANMGWNSTTMGSSANWYTRCYLYVYSYGGAALSLVNLFVGGVGQCGAVGISTTGHFYIVDSTGAAGTTSTNAIPLDQWVRVEFDVTGMSGTTGNAALRYYASPEATSATETLTHNSMTIASSSASAARWGVANIPGFSSTGTTNYAINLQRMVAQTTGPVGPLGSPETWQFISPGGGYSDTWTAPAGVHTAKVELWAAGGGSEGSQASGFGGCGGGGGEYAAEPSLSVTPGTGYAYLLGAGGSAGPNTAAAAGNGGNSTFNTTSVVANGGIGGGLFGAGISVNGGSGSTNTTHFNGGGGAKANGSFGTQGGGGGGSAGPSSAGNTGIVPSTYPNGGAGGAAVTEGGAGGNGANAGGTGLPGNPGFYPGGGAGGAGAASGGTAHIGAVGADGMMAITFTLAWTDQASAAITATTQAVGVAGYQRGASLATTATVSAAGQVNAASGASLAATVTVNALGGSGARPTVIATAVTAVGSTNLVRGAAAGITAFLMAAGGRQSTTSSNPVAASAVIKAAGFVEPGPTVVTGGVTGTYVHLDGTPASGSLTFAASTPALIARARDLIIINQPLVVNLDVNGHFEILLPATDDTEVLPGGWCYFVSENWTGGRKYPLFVPSNKMVDISTGSPVPNDAGIAIVIGPPAPITTLSIGTVATGPVAGASMSGTPANPVLNLTFPQPTAIDGGGPVTAGVNSMDGGSP